MNIKKDPNELINFINSCLKINNKKKKENGEIFTPIKIIEEMINKLEKEDINIFTNPNLKWLDTSSGLGNFFIIIYLRLMNGLKSWEPNEKKRRKHILEEMLYMVEYDKTNVFMLKRIFCGDKYKLNIFYGSFIDGKKYVSEKVPIYNSNIKFDIIIGNPPYNDNKNNPIYNIFIEKSISINPKYIMFIVPSRWFCNGKGLDNFRKMMLNRTDIVFIKHIKKSQTIFGKDIDIRGGVNYFLINKDYNGLCNFNNNFIKLNTYEILIRNQKYYSIINKVINYKFNLLNLPILNSKIETNDKRLIDIKPNDDYIKCWVSILKNKDRIKYIHKDYIIKDFKFGVLICRNDTKGDYITSLIKNDNEVFNNSYILFEVNNEKEAKYLLSYIRSKFFNFLLRVLNSAIFISNKILKYIPLVPLDREWNDETIYKFFKLNFEEIEIINNYKYKND